MVSVFPVFNLQMINILLLTGIVLLIVERPYQSRILAIVGGFVIDTTVSPVFGAVSVGLVLSMGVSQTVAKWYDNKDLIQTLLLSVLGVASFYIGSNAIYRIYASIDPALSFVFQPNFWHYRLIEIVITFIVLLIAQIAYSNYSQTGRINK